MANTIANVFINRLYIKMNRENKLDNKKSVPHVKHVNKVKKGLQSSRYFSEAVDHMITQLSLSGLLGGFHVFIYFPTSQILPDKSIPACTQKCIV